MRTILLTSLALLSLPALAQMSERPETTPYANIYGQMEMVEGIGLELLETRVTAYPAQRGGELPEGLVYIVNTADGPIKYEADERGTALLPFRKDWAEAGYEITSNFPGDVFISSGTLPKDLPNRIRYRDLMAFMAEFQRINIVTSEKWGGRQPHAVNGVMMNYRNLENARVVIEAPWGDEVITATDNGWFEMPVDYVLLVENPWVVLPGTPGAFYGFGG